MKIFNNKFIIVLTLCLGIFGISAFASEIEIPSYVTSAGYPYYVKNSTGIWHFSNTPFYFDNKSNQIGVYSDSTIYYYYSNKINSSSSNYVIARNDDNITDLKSALVYSNSDIVSKIDNSVFFSGEDIYKKITKEIVPMIFKDLNKLLPIGVKLLSILLGVSLVPRLVRLFL